MGPGRGRTFRFPHPLPGPSFFVDRPHGFCYNEGVKGREELTMEKTALKGIKTIAPFDASYIKVGIKGGKWNLMDKDGNILSPTWFSEIERGADGYVKVALPASRAKAPGLSLSFSSVMGMGRAAKAIASNLPPSAFRFVSPESVEPISRPGFVPMA